jgi:hypothetical protein
MRRTILTFTVVFLQLLFYSCSTDNTVMICVSRTSFKYHSKQCKGMRACTHEIEKVTIAEAEAMGKTPCGFCY